MQDTYGEQSTLQLVVDQIEELIVSLIEQIRERPVVAADAAPHVCFLGRFI